MLPWGLWRSSDGDVDAVSISIMSHLSFIMLRIFRFLSDRFTPLH